MANRAVNRRDFFKIVGFAGLSTSIGSMLGTGGKAGSAVPQLELDSIGRAPQPFWVRKVPQPTTEIDWARVQRFDARRAVSGSGSNFANFVGPERAAGLRDQKLKNEKKRLLANTPGYTLKDYAMHAALNSELNDDRSFLGARHTPTPQERGVPQWTGTAEEAARILRIAMRHFGAAEVGFVELDENTRKLIYSFDPDGKELVFENVDLADETPDRRVIPMKAKWAIVFTVQMSGETVRSAPTITASQTTLLSYQRGKFIQNKTQEFLYGLGYQALGQATINALAITPAFAVLAGLGELSRLNRLVTPEFGPMVRVFVMLTDLPVTTDSPIDAGIMRFCQTCKKCAEACPAGALSYSDEPQWEAQGTWNNPGHRAFFEDSVKCFTFWQEHAGSDCSICFAVCPFGNKDKAWIHDLAKASISLLPAMDGQLRTLDDAFSYGAQESPSNWWHLDLPEYGINTDPGS